MIIFPSDEINSSGDKLAVKLYCSALIYTTLLI